MSVGVPPLGKDTEQELPLAGHAACAIPGRANQQTKSAISASALRTQPAQRAWRSRCRITGVGMRARIKTTASKKAWIKSKMEICAPRLANRAKAAVINLYEFELIGFAQSLQARRYGFRCS
ncbi:MAG: hypothetical protein AB1586_27070 [Pseudomonadota bacterium]